jgi:hypothetical protein
MAIPLTPEMLDSLDPQARNTVEMVRRSSGEEAALNVYQSLLEEQNNMAATASAAPAASQGEASRVRVPRTTSRDVRRIRPSVLAARAEALRDRAASRGEQLSWAEAKNRAAREMARIESTPTTLEGDPISGTSFQDIKDAPAWKQPFLAMAPQTIAVGERGSPERSGLDSELHEALRSTFLADPFNQALQEAEEQGINEQLSGQELRDWINDRRFNITAEQWDKLRSVQIIENANALAREERLVDRFDMKPDEHGLLVATNPATGEIDHDYNRTIDAILETQRQAGENAGAQLRHLASNAMPELFDITNSRGNNLHLGTWEVGANMLGGLLSKKQLSDKPEWLVIQEKLAKGETRAQVYEWGRSWVQDDDPLTGTVSETWMGAGTRTLFHALSLAPITFVTLKKLTWDRNPETGLPYNENDYMYRLERWQDEQIDELQELKYRLESGQLSPEEAKEIAGSILKRELSASGAMWSKMVAGSGYNVPEHMNTGSDWSDYWLSLAAGEWSGSYISNMDNIGVMPHWYPTAAGLFLEIVTPIPKTAGALVVGGAKKGVSVSSRAAARFADGLRYENVGEFFRNVDRWADTEKSLTETLVARRALRDYETHGGAGPSGAKLTDDLKGVSTAEDFAGKTGPDVAARVAATEPLSDPFKSKWFKGWNKTDVNGRAVSRIARARDQLWQAAKSKNMLAALAKTRSGRELRDLVVKVRQTMPNASWDAVANETLASYAKKEMYSVLQDALPNTWVRITPNMIAKKTAFRAVQDQFINKSRKYIKHTSKKNADGKLVYKFDDTERTAVAVNIGAAGDRYSDLNRKLISKIKSGEDLSQKEFLRATNFVMNAVAEGLLGKMGKRVIKGQRITERAYRGGTISKALGVKGGASAAAIDRELKAIGGIDDFARGIRVTLFGQSDYLRAVANQGKGTKGLKLVKIDAKSFGKKIDPLLIEGWERTANLMNAVPEKLNRVLASAGDDPNKADRILRELFDGDELASYKEVLELFWAPKGRTFGDLFGNAYGNTDRFSQIISDGLASGAIPKGPLTMNGIRDAVAYVGSRVDLPGLDDLAIKEKRFGGIFGLKDSNDLGQLWSSYVIMKHAQKAFEKGMRLLEEDLPELFVKMPELGGSGAAYRAKMFSDILLEGGIDARLVSKLRVQMKGTLKSYSPSDQRVIAKQVMGYITDSGFLPASNDMSKILEVVQNTMLSVMAKDSDLLRGLGRSVDDMKQVIYRHHGGVRNADGVVQLPVDPDAAIAATKDFDAMSNAWLKASTDLDIDTLHGLLNQLGVPTNAAKVMDSGGVYDIGASFGRLPENRIGFYGPEFEGLIKKFENVDIVARVNENLSQLRPAHREGWAKTAAFFDITRKTTITGLLGGFPLIGTRFMGTNALTAPFIVGITTPSYFATSIRTVPRAIKESFIRASRRTGAVTGPSAYDWRTLERVAGTGDEILFESATGISWTRNMLEEAIDRNNIRFSRATFDFQFDVLADAQRTARLGPNGKPVGGGKTLWNFWRPDRKNFFSMVAEEMDNIQREAVFAQALKNGETEVNAALLARNSMLDYGALPPSSKQQIARKFSFFAFRYRMTADFFGALTRGGKGARNIGKVGALINSQYEDMEEWVLTPDYLKTRFWKSYGKDIQQYSIAHFGIQVPWTESVELLGTISDLFFNREVSTVSKAGALAIAGLDQLDPRMGPILDFFGQNRRMTAADTYAFGGYVPGHFAALCEQLGMFNFAQDFFDWYQVPADEERPDLPRVRGKQWKMTKKGSIKWLLWQEASMFLGIKRNMDDYTRAFAKFGLRDDNIEWRRDGEGNPYLFLLGGTTSSILNSPAHIEMARQRFIYSQYQQMIRNQTR